MSDSDKAYVLDSIMRLSIWEIPEIEKSMRGGIVLSIWTEAVQLENKASAKKWHSLKIDLAPMVQPMVQSNFKNDATKSSQIKSIQVNPSQIKSIQDKPSQDKPIQNSSKEEWEQALELVKDFWNKDINELLETIKGQVEFLWFIYKKGKYERERAKNILTGKDFWKVCEKANMSRTEFCKSIIYTSSLLTFWNWKINNAETLYEHYAKVYNDAVNIKAKKQKDTSLIVF